MVSLHYTDYFQHIENKLLQKLEYIAKHDGRTTEQEIEMMINEWIRAFEDVCGEITTDK